MLSKKRSSQKFFKRSPQKNVFQKIFQALHKILTIQKIVLSSSRGQANFRGIEASRPRPRTSKCVLEDSSSVTDILKLTGISEVRRFYICYSSSSRILQHSLYLNAEQDQADSHRSLTGSSQIATTAIL